MILAELIRIVKHTNYLLREIHRIVTFLMMTGHVSRLDTLGAIEDLPRRTDHPSSLQASRFGAIDGDLSIGEAMSTASAVRLDFLHFGGQLVGLTRNQ